MTFTKNRSKKMGIGSGATKTALKFRNPNPAGLPYCAAVDYPWNKPAMCLGINRCATHVPSKDLPACFRLL